MNNLMKTELSEAYLKTDAVGRYGYTDDFGLYVQMQGLPYSLKSVNRAHALTHTP